MKASMSGLPISHNEKMPSLYRFQTVGLKTLLDFGFNLYHEYVGKGNSHFGSHSCPMNLKIVLSIELEKIFFQN